MGAGTGTHDKHGQPVPAEYLVTLKDRTKEKEFLDALRCRNGNLEISCGRVAAAREEL